VQVAPKKEKKHVLISIATILSDGMKDGHINILKVTMVIATGMVLVLTVNTAVNLVVRKKINYN
jgi:uncharacterized membrane protein YcaP (DUF421 family)